MNFAGIESDRGESQIQRRSTVLPDGDGRESGRQGLDLRHGEAVQKKVGNNEIVDAPGRR